jgi:hypothetical protein
MKIKIVLKSGDIIDIDNVTETTIITNDDNQGLVIREEENTIGNHIVSSSLNMLAVKLKQKRKKDESKD